jgi:hypothetical protein
MSQLQIKSIQPHFLTQSTRVSIVNSDCIPTTTQIRSIHESIEQIKHVFITNYLHKFSYIRNTHIPNNSNLDTHQNNESQNDLRLQHEHRRD